MIAMPDPPLSDGVVMLRAMGRDDIPAIAAACQDPEIPRWTSVPSPYSIEDAIRFVEGQEKDRLEGRAVTFAVAPCDERERVLGSMSITLDQRDRRFGEVGYWTVAAARGRGITTRALRLISRWGIPALPMERLELLTLIANLASQRVADKAGFRREGIRRSGIDLKGRIEDVVVYSMIPADL